MAQIIPKLNLNKTPSLVDNNSLVFAKNIRLDVDTTIHRDYSIFPLSLHRKSPFVNYTYYNTIIYRIIEDVKEEYEANIAYQDENSWFYNLYHQLLYVSGTEIENGINSGENKIVGIIPDSNDFYIFINGRYKNSTDDNDITVKDFIIKYDEKLDKFSLCNCNWHWSGGNINGCILKNLIGETLINIGETGGNILVPFKSINLKTSKYTDDESIYTQVPNIPLTNLSFSGKFSCVIPNGVYQFFVRYKIRKDFYTNWFPASKEIFVGNSNSIDTSYGTLKYTNTHRDSDNSFVLNVEHICPEYEKQYESFQVGFLLSHDDAQYARAWKHFDFGLRTINFDYKATDAIEVEPTDLTKTTYGLYNVGNITSFKNKLYISNYIETSFNDITLQSYADKIGIALRTEPGNETYDGYPILTSTIGGDTVIRGLTIDGIDKNFKGNDGIFHEMCNINLADNNSIEESINNACGTDETTANDVKSTSVDLYGIRIDVMVDSLNQAKENLEKQYPNINTENYKETYSFEYDTSYTINKITINGITKEKSDIFDTIYNTSRYLNKDCQWINQTGKLDDTINIQISRTCVIYKTTSGHGHEPGDPDEPVDPVEPVDPFEPVNPDEPINPLQDSNSNDAIYFSSAKASTSNNSGRESTTITTLYEQNIKITYKAWKNKYSTKDGATLIDNTTLIPYQKYKFYVHYVKSNGETTNGLECKGAGELTAPYMANCNSVIYPEFSNIIIPKGYVSCFFSICHTKVNVATIFNITNSPDNLNNEASCVDIDMMLLPNNKNINIRQTIKSTTETPTNSSDTPSVSESNETPISSSLNGLIVSPIISNEFTSDGTPITYTELEINTGKYYYSSDTSTPRYFGADGVIVFNKDGFQIDNNKLLYLVIDYNVSETDNIDLIKCTPYINKNNLKNITTVNGVTSGSFSDFTTMNLLGYICDITKLDRDRCIKFYTDGSTVYHKKNSTITDLSYDENVGISLKELSKYNDVEETIEKLSKFNLHHTDNILIYSNYNLNYVALSEEPKMNIKTYYNTGASSTSTAANNERNSNTILLRLIPSQLMSNVYSLPSMYKDYLRKTYSLYNDNEITEFNNTIRSSITYGDENNINILAFDVNDYYNVPTNRGTIVNLVAIGDNILVHTKDSMFKFTGSNTLQSSDGEIQAAESQPFDTGIVEMFGSDFGFAGLQNKNDSIITEKGYIFFDRDSHIVYMYSGQGRIEKLSDSIEKLFRHRDISNIYFANDFYNNRIFMSILFNQKYNYAGEVKYRYYPVTISFSTLDEIKSFVSLHDFYYNKAFNTKSNCYFLTRDFKDICAINKEFKGSYTKLAIYNDNIYPSKTDNVYISVYKNTDNKLYKLNINSYSSIIDVIDNSNFENIKTLDSINWCSNIIDDEYKNIDKNDEKTLLMAEDINSGIPCSYLRIYTDSCMTPLNNFNKVSNDYSILSSNNYKYPRYNQGLWTFNYFRNILNSNENKINYVSDQNSLIEGKYFVIRFVFNKEFKLETLSLNYRGKI